MVITGKDELSLVIIDRLSDGMKVKDIPTEYDVSLDQAKRLSRYEKLLRQAEQNLTLEAYQKVQDLGLKVLPFTPLFANQDWLGVEEILSVSTKETRRDDLIAFLKCLEEKRKRIEDYQTSVAFILERHAIFKQNLIKEEEEIKKIKKKIRVSVKELKIYTSDTLDFLLEHVGLYRDHYCLSKRVDSLWHKDLKKNGIVKYHKDGFVYLIPNIDRLAKAFEKRIKRGGVYWDYYKENKRNQGFYPTPDSPYYQNANDLLGKSLKRQATEVKNKIKDIDLKIQEVEEEIKQLKETSVESFIESIQAANLLSANDLKTHGEIQSLVAKWLYSQGYVVAIEVTLSNDRRLDVVGFNEAGHIIAVEVKVRLSDFKGDSKWEQYLDYCDEFFFCFPDSTRFYSWSDTQRWESKNNPILARKQSAGLLSVQKTRIKKVANDIIEHGTTDRDGMIFRISRWTSKKMVYGY